MSSVQIVWVDQDTKDFEVKDGEAIIKLPVAFKDAWRDKRPYQIWKGSRFSAKSRTKAVQLLLKTDSKEYSRVIFARNTQKAARESQFQLFKDLLNTYPFLRERFQVLESTMKIVSKATGDFIKGGSFEDSDSLMSVPNITDFWAEEPISWDGSIKRKDFLSITGSMRNEEGIEPIFHFTFNTINTNNFIYKDFFSDDRVHSDDRVCALTVNYDDNPFCPLDRIAYLDDLKRIDYDRWLVDAKGQWGTTKTGAEFCKKFSRKQHVNDPSFADGLTVHLTLDQNRLPHGTMLCLQVQQVADKVHLNMFDEICEEPPKNSTEEQCDTFLYRYGDMTDRVMYYGDPSGKNKTQKKYKKDGLHHYDVLTDILKDYISYGSDKVAKKAPSLSIRQRVINEVLSGEGKYILNIHSRCVRFIDDCEVLQESPSGDGFVKKKDKNGVEQNGHCMDAFIYFLFMFAPELFKRKKKWK